MKGRFARTWSHAACEGRALRRVFDDALLARVEDAITRGERTHSGELRVAFEAALPLREAWRGRTPRERALEVFGTLGVWDTAANNGVLLYVLWADHAVEIVADRAAAAAIAPERWHAVCEALAAAYREGRYEAGTLAAVERIHALLAAAFPPVEGDLDELPNRPAML